MRILFISNSGFFLDPVRKLTHGVIKRMFTFADALKEVASLDVLLYVDRNFIDTSPSAVAQFESDLKKKWNTDLTLFLCPMHQEGQKGFFGRHWQNYGFPAMSFFKRLGYNNISGQQQVRAFEDCLERGPDAIFVQKLQSMCPLLLTRKDLPTVFFDIDDIEHLVLKRTINKIPEWYKKALMYTQLPVLMAAEKKSIRLARKTFVCSEIARDYLTERYQQEGVVSIPNSVAIPEKQEVTSRPAMMFMGSYYYKPNIECAQFLIDKVWPIITGLIPDAELFIAGVHPESIPAYKSGIPNVTFTGFVDDLDMLYREVKVVATPIFVGGGTRIKIIEAASYGKPVVSTRLGAEGLDFNDGQDLLLRDNAESFAEACIQLLRDTDLCRKLGSAAREKVIALYDRKNIIRLIQEEIKGAL